MSIRQANAILTTAHYILLALAMMLVGAFVTQAAGITPSLLFIVLALVFLILSAVAWGKSPSMEDLVKSRDSVGYFLGEYQRYVKERQRDD